VTVQPFTVGRLGRLACVMTVAIHCLQAETT
jgi:hypothetical protein